MHSLSMKPVKKRLDKLLGRIYHVDIIDEKFMNRLQAKMLHEFETKMKERIYKRIELQCDRDKILDAIGYGITQMNQTLETKNKRMKKLRVFPKIIPIVTTLESRQEELERKEAWKGQEYDVIEEKSVKTEIQEKMEKKVLNGESDYKKYHIPLLYEMTNDKTIEELYSIAERVIWRRDILENKVFSKKVLDEIQKLTAAKVQEPSEVTSESSKSILSEDLESGSESEQSEVLLTKEKPPEVVTSTRKKSDKTKRQHPAEGSGTVEDKEDNKVAEIQDGFFPGRIATEGTKKVKTWETGSDLQASTEIRKKTMHITGKRKPLKHGEMQLPFEKLLAEKKTKEVYQRGVSGEEIPSVKGKETVQLAVIQKEKPIEISEVEKLQESKADLHSEEQEKYVEKPSAEEPKERGCVLPEEVKYEVEMEQYEELKYSELLEQLEECITDEEGEKFSFKERELEDLQTEEEPVIKCESSQITEAFSKEETLESEDKKEILQSVDQIQKQSDEKPKEQHTDGRGIRNKESYSEEINLSGCSEEGTMFEENETEDDNKLCKSPEEESEIQHEISYSVDEEQMIQHAKEGTSGLEYSEKEEAVTEHTEEEEIIKERDSKAGEQTPLTEGVKSEILQTKVPVFDEGQAIKTKCQDLQPEYGEAKPILEASEDQIPFSEKGAAEDIFVDGKTEVNLMQESMIFHGFSSGTTKADEKIECQVEEKTKAEVNEKGKEI